MADLDVVRIVEFEIEQCKEELTHCNYDFDNYKRCSERLTDALELRISQLKDKIKEREQQLWLQSKEKCQLDRYNDVQPSG